jgi:hypothetical protein
VIDRALATLLHLDSSCAERAYAHAIHRVVGPLALIRPTLHACMHACMVQLICKVAQSMSVLALRLAPSTHVHWVESCALARISTACDVTSMTWAEKRPVMWARHSIIDCSVQAFLQDLYMHMPSVLHNEFERDST